MRKCHNLLMLTVAATVLFMTVASAQSPYSCDVTSIPTLTRSEGVAELIGDVLFVCSGAVPAEGIQTNIRVRLNTNIASNVLSGPIEEGIVLLDEWTQSRRGTGAVNPTVYQATRISDTEVEFPGVILAPAGGAGAQTFRVTNIRANASALGGTATIFATVNLTGATAIPLNTGTLVAADSRPGLLFTVTPAAYNDCEAPSGPFMLNFQERLSGAFSPMGDADVDNTVAGGGYRNESGFNPTPLVSGSLTNLGSIGQAAQGTRLIARFSGVPAGMTMTVPQTVRTLSGLVATAITGANSDGSGGSLASGPVTVTTMVVYEVTSAGLISSFRIDTLSVPVTVSYPTPGSIGSVRIKGSLAPLSATFTASDAAPEPRFVDNAAETLAFSVGSCRLSLVSLVQSLGSPAGPLNLDQVDSLVKKLEHFLRELDKTQTTTACNQLQAFTNEVKALVAGHTLTETQGDTLISKAQAISSSLECR